MRSAIVSLFAFLFLLFAPPAGAGTALDSPAGAFAGSDRLLEWMYHYRTRPEPDRLPEAVKAMRGLGLLREDEKAGLFTGFVAGVLGTNPKSANRLVTKLFPIPPKEQAVVIRAIAWSGLPEWEVLLRRHARRMPYRKALIDEYLTGKQLPLAEAPLADGTAVIYGLWGYYLATGHHWPVARIVTALRWAQDKPNYDRSLMDRVRSVFSSEEVIGLDKALIGATAKWTLVSYGERDRMLLAFYRSELPRRTGRTQRQLDDAIKATEKYESERVRTEQLAAIEMEKRRNPDESFNRRTTMGSVAIATGCVIAAVAGQAALGVPCIVGGALYTGATRLLKEAP